MRWAELQPIPRAAGSIHLRGLESSPPEQKAHLGGTFHLLHVLQELKFFANCDDVLKRFYSGQLQNECLSDANFLISISCVSTVYFPFYLQHESFEPSQDMVGKYLKKSRN
jgi:hypothetical protein